MGDLASTAWGRQGAATLRAAQFAPLFFTSLRRGALLGQKEIVPYATELNERLGRWTEAPKPFSPSQSTSWQSVLRLIRWVDRVV